MTQEQPQPKNCNHESATFNHDMGTSVCDNCNKPISSFPQPAQPRLTAEETLSKEMDWPGWIPLTSPVVPTEKVMIAMEAFSRQEVEFKDREWRERIQKRIDELRNNM